MRFQCDFYSEASDQTAFKKEFIHFPEVLFKNDANVKKWPHELEAVYFKIWPLKHDFILLKDQGNIVLRSMICESQHAGTVYFGLLDFDFKHIHVDDIISQYKKIISEWSQKIGAKNILGPINFSTWLPYRLASFSDGGEKFSFEPDRPIAYCELMKKNGFVANQLFSSKGYDHLDNIIALSKSEYERSLKNGYNFEMLGKDLTEKDMMDLHRLSVSIFSENYLATPIDFSTFKSLYAAQSKKDDYSHSFFILSPQGERVGFFINFIEHGYCVIKTIGIDRGHRGTGISNGGMYLTFSKFAEIGVHKMVAAMVKEGAQSESYGRKMHLLWTHLYEILELKL